MQYTLKCEYNCGNINKEKYIRIGKKMPKVRKKGCGKSPEKPPSGFPTENKVKYKVKGLGTDQSLCGMYRDKEQNTRLRVKKPEKGNDEGESTMARWNQSLAARAADQGWICLEGGERSRSASI